MAFSRLTGHSVARLALRPPEQETSMAERFERHRQPWRTDELQKLHTLAKKGMPLRAIAKALTRSEESVKERAKLDGLSIAKLH
jgi:hypothetical protein